MLACGERREGVRSQSSYFRNFEPGPVLCCVLFHFMALLSGETVKGCVLTAPVVILLVSSDNGAKERPTPT